MDSIVQDAKQQLDLQMLNKIEKFKGNLILLIYYMIIIK